MKLNKYVRSKKQALFKIAKPMVKAVRKPIVKLKRKTLYVLHLEVRIFLFLLHKLMRRQFALRPRIRLILQFIVLMSVFYLATFHTVAYIKPKQAEIKINGRPVVLSKSVGESDRINQ